ncbi:MAG TPA: hypothetical protein VMS89_00990 [Methanoregulaceae archaeon]|nr:hypothetical protein [Methanoregulaceae archaeon]
MVDIVSVLILIFDLILSIWNAYVSGYNIGLIRKSGGGGFGEIVSYAGLCLAFAGAVYVLIVILSFVGYILGYVSNDAVDTAFAYDFLVFGILIIIFGLLVTIQSIIAASKKGGWSILGAFYNVFAEVLDISNYVSAFSDTRHMISGNDKDNENVVAIIFIAVLIGFFIVFAAYKHGYNKAMGIVGRNAQRAYYATS